MPSELVLDSGDWRAVVVPEVGGSLARLDWQGEAVMRPATGPGVLDMANFPLVPFSNRIAGSRFAFGGREVDLAPNHPAGGSDPVLHGFGWLAPWQVIEADAARAALRYDHEAGAWPWAFRAEQRLALGAEAALTLSIENRSAEAMPAGLGFHPYFPRAADTRLIAHHRGEWQTDTACLPTKLVELPHPADWWSGAPVGSRTVDTAFSGREGPLRIEWPDRALALTMTPSADLDTTVIYVPAGEDYVCVEPVSHATDAVNRGGMRVLAPGERWEVSLTLSAERLS